MAVDPHLIDRMRPIMARLAPGFAEKKMLGGVAFMVNDKMSCGVTNKNMLMTRVVEAKEQAVLQKPHCRPMDFTGKKMKAFLFVEPDGFDKDADLDFWMSLGVEHALLNPKK